MEKKKIALFDAKPYDMEFFDRVNADFGFEIKYFKAHLNKDTLPLVRGFDAICLFVNDVVTEEVVAGIREAGIGMIALRCAGYNNIDLKAAFRQKLHVARVPAYSPYAVAEHAAALMLTLNRKTHKAFYRAQENNFTIGGLMGFDMFGKTAGVIGTGKIGRVLINILKGFGMRVLAFDPFPNAGAAKSEEFEYVALDRLYAESDVISLHCPLTPQTQYMVNEASIAKMKKGVMIINTSRGKLIDTKALIQGLKSGRIGYAGLDVYEEESEYFFEDYSSQIVEDDVLARLLTFNNVLVTSHQAFFTREAMENITRTTLKNIGDYFEGQALPNEICYHCGQQTADCDKMKNGRCF